MALAGPPISAKNRGGGGAVRLFGTVCLIGQIRYLICGTKRQDLLLTILLRYCTVKEISIMYHIVKVLKVPIPRVKCASCEYHRTPCCEPYSSLGHI